MKVLFATTNPAKIERYANKLREKNIEVLDSISIMPENNKYFVDLTEEERKIGSHQEDDVIEFLVNNIKGEYDD